MDDSNPHTTKQGKTSNTSLDSPLQTAFPLPRNKTNRYSFLSLRSFWIFVLILFAGSSAFLLHRSNTPLRGLEAFPTSEYFKQYKTLEGTRFRANLISVEPLGWKEGRGRYVLFNTSLENKPIVAHLPPEFDNTQFPTGRRFSAVISVHEGGLLRVNYLQAH